MLTINILIVFIVIMSLSLSRDHKTKEPYVGKDLKCHLCSGIIFQTSQQVTVHFGLTNTVPTQWESS